MHDRLAPANDGAVALAREASENYATYAPDRIRPVELRADDMPQLLDWTSDRMGYSLVGSLPPEMLHPLADGIRQQIRDLA